MAPVPAAAGAERTRRHVLGVDLDPLTMVQAVARVEEMLAAGGRHHQLSVNAAKVVALRHDAALREAAAGAALVTADGMAVVWAARLLGRPVPERVAGIDLMDRLLAMAARTGRRVYFVGARPEVVAEVVVRQRRRHPGLVVAGHRDGYWTPEEEPAVVEAIAEAAPDLLFVALPTPRKEVFVHRHLEALGAGVVVGVGGSFDVVAGVVPRAPEWMQRAGLEWFHRLAREPRRMWRRYLSGNSRFVAMVAREALTPPVSRRRSAAP